MKKGKGNLLRACAICLGVFAVAAAVTVTALSAATPEQLVVFSDETGRVHLPFKEVSIKVLPETKVIPGGQSVGVMMDVKGVLVIGLEEIESVEGDVINPGLKAGLQIGDRILKIDGVSVDSAFDVQKILQSTTDAVRLEIRR